MQNSPARAGRTGFAFAIASCFAMVLLVVYILVTRAGLYGPILGVDWAHHMATIDIMARGDSVTDHWAQLGEFHAYPRLSYWWAIWLSDIFSLSTLQGFQVAAFVSVLICNLLSALIIFMVMRNGPSSLGIAVAAILLGTFATLGLTYSGMTTYNGFYSQSVATSIALGFYVIQYRLATREKFWSLAVIVVLGGTVTASFHLAPALWLTGSGLVFMVSCRVPLIRLVAAILAVVTASGLAIYLSPGTAETLRIADVTNGAGGVSGWNFAINHRLDLLVLFYLLLAVGTIALALIAWRRGALAEVRHGLLRQHAGTFGLLGMGVVLFAQIAFSDPVGYYSVAKYVFQFTTFFALAAGMLANESFAAFRSRHGRLASALNLPARRAMAPFWMTLLLLAQGVSLWTSERDQSRLIAIQETRQHPSPYGEPTSLALPNVNQMVPAEEYYISISILGHSREHAGDVTLESQLDSVPFGPRILHPANLSGALEIWSGARLHVSSAEAERHLMTRMAARPAEPWGRWIMGRRFEYLGQTGSQLSNAGICVETFVAAPEDVPQNERLVATFDAGGGMRTVTFDNETRNAIVFVPLPDPMPRSGEFVLAIENIENALGPIGSDASGIGVGLVSMWIAHDACQ